MTNPYQQIHAARLRSKTALFTALVVASSLLGNLCLAWGMRQVDLGSSPLMYVRALFNPWVAFGVSLLIMWLLTHTILLSWADLSYVLPVTSIGYVLTAFTGRFFLHEVISIWRWAGIVCIMAGVTLVGRTSPHSGAAS